MVFSLTLTETSGFFFPNFIVMRFLLPYIFLFLLICDEGFCQDQNNIWHFGNGAGIDFNSGTATAITGGQTNALEATASVCDVNGNLLFYTDGVTAWNKNHAIMPNGTGLAGGTSATQTLIVPKPGDCSKYYIFQVQDHQVGSNNLSYSLVDMCLNNGLGDVVSGSKNIFLNSPCGEKLTAVKHQNGKDIWVIGHKLNSNQFIAYLVTSAGVQSPVTTSIGGSHGANLMIGPAKASHNGNKICVANTFGSLCELFDFNNSTGMLSNYVNLFTTYSLPNGIYGIEFSPNDNLVYIATCFGVNNLYQIDLISSSGTTLNIGPTGNYIYGALQMGPDGKIYMARNNTSSLAVISSPNVSGTAANFVLNGFTLSTGTTCMSGLPNFVPFSFVDEYNSDFISLGNDTNVACASGLTLAPSANCNSTYTWSTGSTSSSINVSSSGTYWVNVNNICGSDTDTIQVNFTAALNLQISGPDSICPWTSNYLTATGATSYSWSTGANSATTWINPGVSTSYAVTGTTGACTATAVHFVNVVQSPTVTASGPTQMCQGESLLFTASGAPGIQWFGSFNISDPQNDTTYISPDSSLTLFVTGSNYCGIDTDWFSITVDPVPVTSFISGSDCNAFSFDAATSPGATYSWNFGDGTLSQLEDPAHSYSQAGTYALSLVVSLNGCTDTISQAITASAGQFEDLIVPNTFTPNGDIVNDVYKLYSENICFPTVIEAAIYNRWGQMVFETEDIFSHGWDGKFQGKAVPDGVYFIMLYRKNELIFHGPLHIFR
jgi:gliding motility-associated-like protein